MDLYLITEISSYFELIFGQQSHSIQRHLSFFTLCSVINNCRMVVKNFIIVNYAIDLHPGNHLVQLTSSYCCCQRILLNRENFILVQSILLHVETSLSKKIYCHFQTESKFEDKRQLG